MIITVTLLNTVEECDNLISVLNEEKDDATYRKEGITRSKERLLARKTKRDADLASTQAQIDSLNSVIAGLPEGEIKDNFIYEKTLEEHKLYKLQNASEVSLDSYFVKESEESNIDSEIANYDTAIAEVDAHKATL